VLFFINDGSGRVAEVHLTWSKKQERLPWPISRIYNNFNALEEEKWRDLHHEKK
jgi:hypothetical protein